MIVDEDVPGGGTAYILNELIENQHIFNLLDSKPKTLSAKAHRPAYGSDGTISQNQVLMILLKLPMIRCMNSTPNSSKLN